MKQKLYCNFCGHSLEFEVLEGRERQACKGCGQVHYENPLPVVSVILPNRKREILLVKREREPFKDMWCFPIGFAEMGESVEDAALRELKEECGVEGRIVQLVDVGSHANPLYGDLLIVTFEAEKAGGEEKAGDDASECRYFPVKNLPKLAFDSQEKAIQKYVELKKDLWQIHDSFETFVEGALQDRIVYPRNLLSDDLIGAVKENSQRIVELWIDDITTNPSTTSYARLDRLDLSARAMVMLNQFEGWLKGKKGEKEFKDFYFTLGGKRRAEGVPLEELISSISLLKKHMWMFTYSYGVWERALDIYRMFELGERLVYFFDRAAYYTVIGYRQST
jgi:ADP-ribose pyrophosphatase YjhB (NUDIX family)